MNVNEMSDQQVHIALLEAVGWTGVRLCDDGMYGTSPRGFYMQHPPDLDRNLIHEAEMMMLTSSPPVGNWNLYVETVTKKTEDPREALFLHVQSNHLKLARALLKALGKSDER